MCCEQMRIREELRPDPRERNTALLEDATAQMKVPGAPQALDVLAVHTTQLHCIESSIFPHDVIDFHFVSSFVCCSVTVGVDPCVWQCYKARECQMFEIP